MSTVNTETRPAFANVVYLIDDQNNLLRNSLLVKAGGDDSRSELTLDTKYYSCNVTLRSFSSFDEAQASTVYGKDDRIGAIIINFSKDRCILSRIKEALKWWNVETWACFIIVCELLEPDAVWSTELRRLCVSEGIELVELNPLQETIAELNGYRELYGIPRIIQVLETITWTQKVLANASVGQKITISSCDYGETESSSCLSEDLPPKKTNRQYFVDYETLLKEKKQKNGFSGKESDDFGDFHVFSTNSKKEPETGNFGTYGRKTDFPVQDSLEKPSVKEKASLKVLSQKLQAENSEEITDKLVGGDEDFTGMIKQFKEVRLHLSQMPFGRERQEYATNTMLQLVKVLGEDLLEELTEEES